MELQQQAQHDLYAQVRVYLHECFGELAVPDEDAPFFSVGLGRIRLRIGVAPIGEDEAAVDFFTWLAQGLPVTEDLLRALAERNHQLRLGQLGLDDDGDVSFAYSLPREAVTKAAIGRVVPVLVRTAEDLEDELNLRFR